MFFRATVLAIYVERQNNFNLTTNNFHTRHFSFTLTQFHIKCQFFYLGKNSAQHPWKSINCCRMMCCCMRSTWRKRMNWKVMDITLKKKNQLTNTINDPSKNAKILSHIWSTDVHTHNMKLSPEKYEKYSPETFPEICHSHTSESQQQQQNQFSSKVSYVHVTEKDINVVVMLVRFLRCVSRFTHSHFSLSFLQWRCVVFFRDWLASFLPS